MNQKFNKNENAIYLGNFKFECAFFCVYPNVYVLGIIQVVQDIINAEKG